MMRGAPSPCIFCQIAHSSASTPPLHSDNKVVAFRDINPSAFRHYLVIPIEHIPTVNNLQRTPHDFSLVSHMLDVGQTLLIRDAPHSKYRWYFTMVSKHEVMCLIRHLLNFDSYLDFISPPFNSVDHLHLHCFALPFTPSWRSVKYLSLGPFGGFIEAEKLLQKIKPSSVP